MVNLNRSFLYGICFASLTWIISLYLYFQISSSENSTKISADFTIWTQEHISSKIQIQKKNTTQNENTLSSSQNTPELIKKLTPIKKRNEDLDNGMYKKKCIIEYYLYNSQN